MAGRGKLLVLPLDHIPRIPLLHPVDDWVKSATLERWARLTRALITGVIADIDDYLDEEE